ncbi:non-canonical purine NTP pyrophosphatase [Elioraea sp. Yellowstone]|uniref:non-canonical purine NTP pyrophosphatase n=1 Tax=Elioraea sp. Yellowstone TaxID=2592070 RepID=UPI001151E07E|nr:non-canonical purine NTP pyrophosphatase [Elioraea sp. Yellowstone]TQF78080.1 non-canonical purine NTP pyrophosphatase [Elioraea sp. Yellowstone]
MTERRLSRGDRLVVATHNPGKLAEIAALLAPLGVEALGAAALGLAEPAETGSTFAENATIKALAAARAAGLPALADDSGFSVAALDGAPGVHTADWATLPDGSRDYGVAMALTRARIGEPEDARAWFTCCLALAWPDGAVETFEGRIDGTWVWPPRGTEGFGYDPMFLPDGEAETFGEMAPARKHAISHRARAFAALRSRLG